MWLYKACSVQLKVIGASDIKLFTADAEHYILLNNIYLNC